ncbi:hypothetical protein OSTOST_12087, partial [Ostertagia ostertagi]
MAPIQHSFSPILQSFPKEHRGELDMSEKYNYDLSKAQLKASSRTSALLAGFAMVALVELQYDQNTPHWLLILLGVVTTLLVSVHLLALMMSTCILPYMEATGCTQDSPHIRLKFYIDLSWLFSTCIGLLLFLVEIGIIFFVKFTSVDYQLAGYITTGMLIPVVVVFVIFSYLIHRSRPQMPRSFDPTRTALLKKSSAPRCSISVDDIQSLSSKNVTNSASILWPVPRFTLEVPTLANGSSTTSLRPPSPLPPRGADTPGADFDYRLVCSSSAEKDLYGLSFLSYTQQLST